MEILIGIIVFIYGSIFGSFYNVVGYRLSNDMSLIKPRGSFCPNCKHELKWFELIPILSFLIQKGRCRKCKKKIAIFYPLIELSTAILFLISYLIFGISYEFIIALILSSYLVIVMVSDFKYMIIPDEVTLFCGALTIIIEILAYGPLKTLDYILAGSLLFLIVFLFMKITSYIFKKESLGGGDIKLEFVIGLILGFTNGIFSIFIGSIIAFPIAIINQMKNKTNMIAFGPFLLIGAIILYFLKIDVFEILKNLTYL